MTELNQILLNYYDTKIRTALNEIKLGKKNSVELHDLDGIKYYVRAEDLSTNSETHFLRDNPIGRVSLLEFYSLFKTDLQEAKNIYKQLYS